METFYSIARYKKRGCILEFTVLTKRETILYEIWKHYGFEAPWARVKYLIPNDHKIMSSINSQSDFY